MAGLAFDQSGLGIIHSLAGPVAGRYGLYILDEVLDIADAMLPGK